MFKYKTGNEFGYSHNKPVAHITHTMNRNDIIALLTVAGKAYGQEDLKFMFTATPLGGQIIKGLEAEIASSEQTLVMQGSKIKRLESENNTLYQRLENAKAELDAILRKQSRHVFESPSVIVSSPLRAELGMVKASMRRLKEESVALRAELQEAKAEAAKYKAMATQEVIEMSRKLTQGIMPSRTAGEFYCSVPGGRAPEVKHVDIDTALGEARRLCSSGLVKVVQVFRLEYTVQPPTYEGGLFNITKSEA